MASDTQGTLFTGVEFLFAASSGALTDWDGFGYLCTATHTAKKLARVKTLRKKASLPSPYTHVLWFNR